MNKLRELKKSIEDHTGEIVIATVSVTIALVGFEKILKDHKVVISWTNLPESLTEAIVVEEAKKVLTIT